MAVSPIPDGYPRVSPYLYVDGADAAIAFYSDIFGATERMRMPGPDGKVGHAELGIGDSLIMLADADAGMDQPSPKATGGTPVALSVYVEDVDDVVARAAAAGATIVRPAEDQFYGDRLALIEDPFGHRWGVATHVEDVSPEDMERRLGEMMGG